MIGTKMTYSVVMKPAFVAVAYRSPACCRLEPANKTRPALAMKYKDIRSKTGIDLRFSLPGIFPSFDRLPLFNGFNLLNGNKTSKQA
jgi:hypothetical protein